MHIIERIQFKFKFAYEFNLIKLFKKFSFRFVKYYFHGEKNQKRKWLSFYYLLNGKLLGWNAQLDRNFMQSQEQCSLKSLEKSQLDQQI